MSTVNILSLILIIISLTATGFALYKLSLKEYIKKQRHQFLTPAGLSGNPRWTVLLEDWKSLSRLKSWTPEYSRAEEIYRLKLREFLQTDLNKPNILDVPIVALAFQCTEVYIERYHTQVGDLDYKKSLEDSGHIIHVMHKGNLPENIVSTIRKIRGAEDFVDDEGVDAAMNQFRKIKKEIQDLNIAASVSESAEIDNQLPKQPPEPADSK